MISKENKQKMYVDGRQKTECSQEQWASIFNLGKNKGQQNVSTKENGSRAVNMPEALSAQLLSFLQDQGFDIKNVEFDDAGFLIDIPKVL